MSLTKRWAGRTWGTNIGNLFVVLDGDDAALGGVLRINEQGVGIAAYSVVGTFEAPTLKLTGTPAAEVEGVFREGLTTISPESLEAFVRGEPVSVRDRQDEVPQS